MSAPKSLDGEDIAPHTSPVRAGAASFAGAVMDWYDFFVYGLIAALVFPKLFFPASDPASAALLNFATFGVGFLARPVGGIVFGHFGDRIGRKAMLVLTVVLMGLGTALIGLMPTYEQVGMPASILLVGLRFLQGFAVGGEWGGAALMAVEHAPEAQRGFFGSFVQVGASVGLLTATSVVALTSAITTNDEFLTWGWRIPFLVSVVVVFGGYMIRRSVDESPQFVVASKDGHEKARAPLIEALRQHPTAFVKIIAMRLAELVTFYTVTVYALNYGTKLGIPRSSLLDATLVVGLVSLVLVPAAAALSDRIGRRPVYCFGALVGAVGAFPLFWALESLNLSYIILAFVLVANFSASLVVAVQQPLFAEMFDPSFRYSGTGVAYQLASALAGGSTPLVAAWLALQDGGRYTYVALYLAGACLISLVTGLFFTGHSRPSLQ
jgi:MHS family shikimate/dehydroshikimate transporter-like MFS transporter